MRRAAALLLVLVWPAAAAGAALALGDAERREAVRVGERSVTSETFGDEWRVPNAAGESVVVLTGFHRVALAARHAAFNGKTVPAAEVERVLREQRDRLVVRAFLRGQGQQFARHYRPWLVVGDRHVSPAFVQNEHTAARQEDGSFLARCVYGFPTRDLSGRARVALVVADADGREVSRFTIDLSAMR